tara:strand:+ start:782 stop:2725 length:1944 start_codon:yes stop_codon:yes gene_type:complete
MIKETIVIDAETGKAGNNIDKLAKAIGKLTDSVDELGKESKESIDNIEKSAKNTEKGVKGIGKAFKGLGTAIKAAGIGLVIGALSTLKDIFTQNQKVADLFNTAFEATSLVFNDFVSFIVDSSTTVTDFFKNIFENPLESVKSLGKAIQDNLIERAKSLLEVYGFLGEALVKLFKGDFKGALDSVKEAGKELVDVYTGVDGSAEKIANGLDKVTKAAVKYGKEIVNTAKENVKLQNEAEIATAQQSRLVEQYDRQAEKLRQIRDNDLLTLEERTKANDELLVVLNNQEDAMLKQAEAQVKAAQAAVDKNANIENQIALTEALTNKEGVLAQVEGFRSEQDSNRNALKKEGLELTNSQKEAEGQLLISQLEGNAELLTNEHAKLLALRAAADEEKRIQEDLLTSKRDSYKEGTQAYQDANNELLAFQVEIKQKQAELDREIKESEIEAKKKENAAIKALNDKKLNDEIAQRKAEEENRQKQYAVVGNAIGDLQNIFAAFGKESKALAIAGIVTEQVASISKIISNTGIANAKAVAASPLTLGQPFVGINSVSAGLSIAGSVAGAAKAISDLKSNKKSPSTGSPSSGVRGGAPQVPQSPSFNLVGQGGTNQLAEAIGSQSQQPVRAYVVGGDVTTAQSLDRNIIESASL